MSRRLLDPHEPNLCCLCCAPPPPGVQRGKPGPDASDIKFTDADRGTKDNPFVNGDAMDVALSPGTAGGAGRSADRNENEDKRHGDASVDMHAGGAASHGGWS